jgi:CheY-like chemotaxis protein
MDVNVLGAEWKDKSVSAADLLRLLKTQPPTTHIPIILMTGPMLWSMNSNIC